MKVYFKKVLDSYSTATHQPFGKHPIAELLRTTIPRELVNHLSEPDRYLIKGSAGQGQWTAAPWIAIFDILITQTAQSGFYPVFLFKEDMSGVYLSLNQGVTDLKNKYKRKADEVLKLKSEDYRAQLAKRSSNFNLDSIDLSGPNGSSGRLSELYEAGNIIAKYYSSDNLPDDSVFFSDTNEILEIYRGLTFNESLPENSFNPEVDESTFIGVENIQRFRYHKKIERNQKLIKEVKKHHGYRCQACEINFQEKYGELGKDFIEAHHLTPISKLKGNTAELDIRKDFTVLCSNCHSMIHRLDDPSDLKLLKSLIQFDA